MKPILLRVRFWVYGGNREGFRLGNNIIIAIPVVARAKMAQRFDFPLDLTDSEMYSWGSRGRTSFEMFQHPTAPLVRVVVGVGISSRLVSLKVKQYWC